MKDFPTIGKKGAGRLYRQKPENAKLASFKFVMTWFVLILVAMFFVKQRLNYIQTDRSVKKMLIEKNKLETTILPLILEERFLTRFSIIDSQAKGILSLDEPKKNQIIKIEIRDNK